LRRAGVQASAAGRLAAVHEGLSVATNIRRKLARRIGAACALALLSLGVRATAGDGYGAPSPDLKLHLDRLVRAYPDWITGADDRFVHLKNGGKFPISDGRTDKSFDELLEHPDIDDMFYVPYPAGSAPAAPAKNIDPGRVRFEPLFVAMYGDCHKNEVAAKLKAVEWLPQHQGGKVSVTAVNGVADALAKVSRALDQLPAEFVKFLVPNAGTYNCRDIAGSSMRSAHAYGVAIDISTKAADYWRWSANPQAPVWKNRIPVEIVRLFEQHGFIWGGYWYHFDTMHFEYRPELLPEQPGRG
jgi:D-alanyl-D-alanine carboxypeptidase-like protein